MSESFHIELGGPLPLSLMLPSGGSGFFPQADIYDSADSAVAGSPFDLTEVGATSRYTGSSFTPLAVGTFTARFVVYSDAGHTTEALQYTRDQDSYSVEPVGATAAALALVATDAANVSDHLALESGQVRTVTGGSTGAGTIVTDNGTHNWTDAAGVVTITKV